MSPLKRWRQTDKLVNGMVMGGTVGLCVNFGETVCDNVGEREGDGVEGKYCSLSSGYRVECRVIALTSIVVLTDATELQTDREWANVGGQRK